jgi:hypothetical protein
MTATAQDLSRAADPIRLALRLAGLWPRLAAAVTQAAIRQTRAVSGLDYSLIDYPGILSAAYRFGLSGGSSRIVRWLRKQSSGGATSR